MKPFDIKEPLEYHGRGGNCWIVFKSATHNIADSAVVVTYEFEVTMQELLQAQMDFSVWYFEEVYPKLNGFRGSDCVNYDLSHLSIKEQK
jgi:hypothetical protein